MGSTLAWPFRASATGRPRRILSIDGGGIRGLIPIEVLVELERRLAERSGRPDAVLADHFDLVAGTSAGALVAAAISIGRPMAQTRQFVVENAGRMFKAAAWHKRLWHLYDEGEFEARIKAFLGERTRLGSPELRTGVLLVMRNATTDSPWIVSNNPFAPFNERTLDDCNLELELWRLARASAAAPVYFAPEVVTLGRAKPYKFIFVDGALTGFNNPAFKAFLYATTGPYGLNWPASEEQLTVVSLGTGYSRHVDIALRPRRMGLLWNIGEVPRALILASDREQDLLCRTFGACRMGPAIDVEVGDMRGARSAVPRKLFTYFRIDTWLTGEKLAELGVPDPGALAASRLDTVANADGLRRVGEALASRDVTPQLLDYLLAGGPGVSPSSNS